MKKNRENQTEKQMEELPAKLRNAGKPKKKPDYDAEAVTAELVEAAAAAYEGLDERGRHPSLRAAAEQLGCGLNPLKVRKLLITAGELRKQRVYRSVTAEKVLKLWKEGKQVEEIMAELNLSRASVQSYLPYSKIIYKLDEAGSVCSVGADRMKVYRERRKAVEALAAEPGFEMLWQAVVLFAGYPFQTSKGLKFSYTVKGGEIHVDRKEKSITRATVHMAFHRANELEGKVSGPKKLGVFGASYLYPVFVRLGVIRLP
ncbi:MAG: hypothetical protein Q4F29_04445 [Lachnospiraceae bacterium]|nr:hypothetical protein [Lachnospiraceae bacterium]